MLHCIEIAVQKICLAAMLGLLRKSSGRKKTPVCIASPAFWFSSIIAAD